VERTDPSAPWQPPLTFWSHAWRLGLAAAISAVVWSSVAQRQWQEAPALFWVDLLIGVASFGVVLLRRRYPFGTAVALAWVSVFSGSAAGPSTLAAVSLATRRRYAQIVVVALSNWLSVEVFAAIQQIDNPAPRWVSTGINVAVIAAMMAFGMYIGSRRELLWTLRERALRAETEQALRVGQARATERERIAREMHDVLGHRISLVTMHAGALAYRQDLDKGQVAASARVIQDNAHQAMVELRSILGVLRGTDGDPPPDQPQPTLRDVPALVEEAVASGTVVDLAVDVRDELDLPEQVGRTVYRVVQEGLTNVRKHAGAAHVSVRVTGDRASGVSVRLDNPLPPGHRSRGEPGFGLVGLTERAELAGGTLRWRVQDGRFVLEVWLPWQR
jgi:signal transduction histidine kinase